MERCKRERLYTVEELKGEIREIKGRISEIMVRL